MSKDFVVAIIAAMLNIVLSMFVPTLFNDTGLPLGAQIKQSYDCNRKIILFNSIMIVIFVYIALKITPWVDQNVFSTLAKLGQK
jgi:hypothetical protein